MSRVVTEAADGRQVVLRPVASVNKNHKQERHAAGGNCGQFQPTWRAGVGWRTDHLGLLSLAILKANATCDKRHSVRNDVNEQLGANVCY